MHRRRTEKHWPSAALLGLLALVGALLLSPPGADAFHSCRFDVQPESNRHFSAGDLFVGSLEVQCPTETDAFDLYVLLGFLATPACPSELLLVFLQPTGLHVVCQGQLADRPPTPIVGAFAPPGGRLTAELLRLPWPQIPSLRIFLWGVCAGAPGTRFLSGDSRCSLSTLTQPSSLGFTVAMPVLSSETGNTALGLWPFGVHGSDHTYDGGHPGIDVEFAAGASVRAAAGGTVQTVMTDFHDPTKTTVQLQHQVGRQGYRTVYTNIEEPAVRPGERVTVGQPLGRAGRVGNSLGTYYMTHFQVDDFSTTNPNPGVSNPNSVSPESYFTPEARAIFDRMWAVAAYNSELTEPFPTNPRTVANPFPIRRTWTLQSRPPGSTLPPQIRFIYRDPATDRMNPVNHDYELLDANGAVTETGSVQLQPSRTPPSRITLQPLNAQRQAAGQARQGVYDVVSGTMRIDFGAPGAPRPADLSQAAVYTTQ